MLDYLEETKMKTTDAYITKRLIIKGKLRLLSPLIIGGGSSLYGDSDVIVLKIKDEKGEEKPYIPSTSITGALKHHFENYNYLGSEKNYEENKRWFWGGEYLDKKKGEDIRRSCQSSLIISDLYLADNSSAHISIRDGIRLNSHTGVVEDKAKFDYEIVEAGAVFDFNMEVVIRKAFNEELFYSFSSWIINELSSGNFTLGAKTGQGFGQVILEEIELYIFDYSKKEDIIAWLCDDYQHNKKDIKELVNLKLFVKKTSSFAIKTKMILKNSLIIGAYSGDVEGTDKEFLKSSNSDGERVPVLPGTSIRGAIRARAEKIINTLGGNGAELVKSLFGWVDNSQAEDKENPIKGRILVKEKYLDLKYFVEEIQHRIRIDRFTGGVIDGALFDSMPLWPKPDESVVEIEFLIKDYKPWEAGLMLLVLKDLWLGDLAIGGEKGIGRGVFQGKSAVISLADEKIVIEEGKNSLLVYKLKDKPGWDEEAAATLEQLVEAFHAELSVNDLPKVGEGNC